MGGADHTRSYGATQYEAGRPGVGVRAPVDGARKQRHGRSVGCRRIASISENTAFATVWSKKPCRAGLGRGGPASAMSAGRSFGLAARGFCGSLGAIFAALWTLAGVEGVFWVAIRLGFAVVRNALMSISLDRRNAASVSCATVSGWVESRARLRSRFA